MADTSIEWTDKTWNPTRGCSRQGPECENCYAMRQAHRQSGPGGAYEGLTVIRNGKIDWAGFARFIPDQLDWPLHRRKPQKIFVDSMSDLFHPSISNEEILKVFAVMAACRKHTFQLLTKQAERMFEWFEQVDLFRISEQMKLLDLPTKGDYRRTVDVWPLPNVWLGVSAGLQSTADKRIPLLLKCPAAIRFVSAEPLLEPVRFDHLDVEAAGDKDWCTINALTGRHTDMGRPCPDVPKLDWVIVGGESSYGARTTEVAAIRSIVEHCKAAGIAVFVKQLGAKTAFALTDNYSGLVNLGRKGQNIEAFPPDLQIQQFPEVRVT